MQRNGEIFHCYTIKQLQDGSISLSSELYTIYLFMFVWRSHQHVWAENSLWQSALGGRRNLDEGQWMLGDLVIPCDMDTSCCTTWKGTPGCTWALHNQSPTYLKSAPTTHFIAICILLQHLRAFHATAKPNSELHQHD